MLRDTDEQPGRFLDRLPFRVRQRATIREPIAYRDDRVMGCGGWPDIISNLRGFDQCVPLTCDEKRDERPEVTSISCLERVDVSSAVGAADNHRKQTGFDEHEAGDGASDAAVPSAKG